LATPSTELRPKANSCSRLLYKIISSNFWSASLPTGRIISSNFWSARLSNKKTQKKISKNKQNPFVSLKV